MGKFYVYVYFFVGVENFGKFVFCKDGIVKRNKELIYKYIILYIILDK